LGALENNDRGPIARGLRIAADLGMTRLAEATLQRGIDTPARAPGLLSPRQAEVLRLVAQGRTNREIARALVLTEGTVANHLSAIFSKIGVDNRAAAVAYALRERLA